MNAATQQVVADAILELITARTSSPLRQHDDLPPLGDQLDAILRRSGLAIGAADVVDDGETKAREDAQSEGWNTAWETAMNALLGLSPEPALLANGQTIEKAVELSVVDETLQEARRWGED